MLAMQAFYERISTSNSASHSQILDATCGSTWMLWDMSQG